LGARRSLGPGLGSSRLGEKKFRRNGPGRYRNGYSASAGSSRQTSAPGLKSLDEEMGIAKDGLGGSACDSRGVEKSSQGQGKGGARSLLLGVVEKENCSNGAAREKAGVNLSHYGSESEAA